MYNINVVSKNVPNIDYVICKRTFIIVCAERREVVKYSNLIHNANPSQLDKAQWYIYTIYDLQNCGFKIFYLIDDVNSSQLGEAQ